MTNSTTNEKLAEHIAADLYQAINHSELWNEEMIMALLDNYDEVMMLSKTYLRQDLKTHYGK